MIARILAEWRRLVLPPEGLAVRVLEQPEDGRAPVEADPDQVLWKKHLTGFASYLVDPAWSDPETGRRLTRIGVVAVPGDGEAALAAGTALHRRARDAGLAAALQWGGDGGVRLWLFSAPVAVELMEGAVRRLSGADGRPPPEPAGTVTRPVLLVPGWDRRARGWTYFYRPDETPTPVDSEVLPSGLLAYQLEVLAAVEPTPPEAVAGVAATPPGPAAGTAPVAALQRPAVRVCEVLSDPGPPVRLMVQRADGAWEMVGLDPAAALDLARDLVEAVRRKLPG